MIIATSADQKPGEIFFPGPPYVTVKSRFSVGRINPGPSTGSPSRIRDGNWLGGQNGSEAVREIRLRFFVQNGIPRSSLDCERTSTNKKRFAGTSRPLESDKTVSQSPERYDCLQFFPDSSPYRHGCRYLCRPSGVLVVTRSCSARSPRRGDRFGKRS